MWIEEGRADDLLVRIPTAPNPHESWIPAIAPDFFAEVRQRGLRLNRVTRCSNCIFSNSPSEMVLSKNSVSIVLKLRCDGTFFKVWLGSEREKVNQIYSLSAAIERLKI